MVVQADLYDDEIRPEGEDAVVEEGELLPGVAAAEARIGDFDGALGPAPGEQRLEALRFTSDLEVEQGFHPTS